MENKQVAIAYKNSWFLNFVLEGKYRWIRHAIVIVIIVGLHFLPSPDQTDGNPKKELWLFFSRAVSVTLLLGFFYINHCILIPSYLLKSRFTAYAISLLSFCIFVFLILSILERIDFPSMDKGTDSLLEWHDFFILSVLLMVFIAAVSSLKLFKAWLVDLIRFKEFENNTLTIQLEQLKSQINPHFLFNTLNNINFLIDENPRLASTVLLKLSDILRNQLYLSKEDTILLQEEITVLNNILFMEDIRRDEFVINFTVEEGVAALKVPPFLFIPFVENVIKHGGHQVMENDKHATIRFYITDRRLCFICKNAKKKKGNPVDHGGLGLSNIRKRLDIIYQKDYHLEIDDSNESFDVFLDIPLAPEYDEN